MADELLFTTFSIEELNQSSSLHNMDLPSHSSSSNDWATDDSVQLFVDPEPCVLEVPAVASVMPLNTAELAQVEPRASEPALQRFHPAIGVAATAVSVAVVITRAIIDANWENHKRRSEYTQTVVKRMRDNDPTFNYVICATDHHLDVQGKAGEDYGKIQLKFPVWWGQLSTTFYAYSFRKGIFHLKGDGGYLNWAYMGNVVRDTGGRPPRYVTFASPI
ncbi:hypothetical protein B0H12DRAFT_1074890 [Mycena haematopus]|nr:hypothetical protein B0H12DRAFT_1074890 [Mycena haematopus]